MKLVGYAVIITVVAALGLTIWAFNENPNAYGVMTSQQEQEHYEQREAAQQLRERHAAQTTHEVQKNRKKLEEWQAEQAKDISPSGANASPPGP